MNGLRTMQESDGVRVVLRHDRIIAGPLKALFWGVAMIGTPLLAAELVHVAAPRFDDYRPIILAFELPLGGIGLLFVFAGVFGLLPLSNEARVTPDLLIWDRWNGPIRSRRQWRRSAIMGFEVLPDDNRPGKASIQIKGNFDETPEIAIGTPRDLASELAAELTRLCQCGSAP